MQDGYFTHLTKEAHDWSGRYIFGEKELSEALYDSICKDYLAQRRGYLAYADGCDLKSKKENNVQAVASSTGMPRYCCCS